jgi:2,5-diketo-D-gluconate reductase A
MLSNGISLPWVGLGVWQVEDSDVISTMVRTALDNGYSHFDTAQAYNNEHLLGEAMAAHGSRKDYFITTKLANTNQGNVENSFDESLKKLKTDSVDQFLMHWPSPWRGQYVDAWKAMVQIYKDGRAKSIGVSNVGPAHLEKIIDATGFVPHVNQVERHPLYQQKELADYCSKLAIAMVAYSPLATGNMQKFSPSVEPLAKKHGKSVAQVVLRWHLQTGWATVPKSVSPTRIAENIGIFDFQLDDDDMSVMKSLDSSTRFLPDADEATF